VQEVVSTGRSGSFFFQSEDNKYLIKTLPAEEYSMFRKLLPSYYRHLKNFPNSLLTRFYGLYKIKIGDTTLYFIIMENLFSSPLEIYEIYDLKGSSVNRSVVSKLEVWTPNVALKDRDLHQRINIGPVLKAKLLEQLEIDCKLLESFNICDYSLLIGFHHVEQNIPSPEERENLYGTQTSIFKEYQGGILSKDSENKEIGEDLYFIGLIDILTAYDFKKKGEHVLKSLVWDKNEISAIAPEPYRKRFLRYIVQITD